MTAETLKSQDFRVLLSNAFGDDKVEDTRKVFEFILNPKSLKREVVDEVKQEVASKDFVGKEIAEVKTELAEVKAELKQDIAEVRAELKQDIAEVRAELKQDIAEVRAELKQDIAEVRAELKQDIAEVRAELAEVKAELKQDISNNAIKYIYWLLGVGVAVVTTIVGAAWALYTQIKPLLNS